MKHAAEMLGRMVLSAGMAAEVPAWWKEVPVLRITCFFTGKNQLTGHWLKKNQSSTGLCSEI